jgi:hypothetical protein
MKLITKTASCLMMTAFSAMAMNQHFVDPMIASAQNIQRHANLVSAAMKDKKADAGDVQKKIEAMRADVAGLNELVAQFEATNPQFSASEGALWKLVKDKVQLLGIFHDQKSKLASEDFTRHRALIRAHADGVAKRAEMLRRTLTKLTPPVS